MSQLIVDKVWWSTYLKLMKEYLDARGLICPLPVLKARKRLKTMCCGNLLQVRADDPAAQIDIPHFCTDSGNILVEITKNRDGSTCYLIQKS